MTLPLLSQHVVCPVAGSGQHHPLRGPRSRTRLTRNDASVLIFEAGGERRLPDAGRTSSETRTWRRRVVLAVRLEAIPSLSRAVAHPFPDAEHPCRQAVARARTLTAG